MAVSFGFSVFVYAYWGLCDNTSLWPAASLATTTASRYSNIVRWTQSIAKGPYCFQADIGNVCGTLVLWAGAATITHLPTSPKRPNALVYEILAEGVKSGPVFSFQFIIRASWWLSISPSPNVLRADRIYRQKQRSAACLLLFYCTYSVVLLF
jgi:hypothetical protein